MSIPKSAQAELMNRLEKVPLGRMYQAGFKALMRLQVYFTGRTHEMMLAYTERARGLTLRAGGKEGTLDGVSGFGLQAELLRSWGDTWSEWTAEFHQAQREAARIAFGVQAVYHERLVIPLSTPLSTPLSRSTVTSPQMRESAAFGGREMTEGIVEGVYEPQLRLLLNTAEDYMHSDGLNLSGRIWRIDRETREGINAVILNGLQSGDSAWNIAKNLEQYLGAGTDCPRWTSTRLYGTTAKEKVISTAGLFSGDACNGQGVSYNALRLARTELQKIHALATDRMMAQQPWVEEEQVHLSASHPEIDICDGVTSGGRDGEGIYEVGEIALPLHPNCLCYKTAVLMPEKEFTSRLRDWMRGEGEWVEMDQYARELGVDVSSSLLPAAINLAVWLFGDDLKGWLQ